jgi:hypothetical protein
LNNGNLTVENTNGQITAGSVTGDAIARHSFAALC